MADRPILFSAPMVRALLAGTKTQTRRVLKPQIVCYLGEVPSFSWGKFSGLFPDDWFGYGNEIDGALPYRPGDRLWVREAWRCNGWASDVATIFYRASEGDGYTAMCEQYPVAGKKPIRVTGTWRPGIHMPRWASRITLTVTEVRVQRLQEISEADARAEGPPAVCAEPSMVDGGVMVLPDAEKPWHRATPRAWYRTLWDSINADRAPWSSNPWIVAVTFTPAAGNIDQVRP